MCGVYEAVSAVEIDLLSSDGMLTEAKNRGEVFNISFRQSALKGTGKEPSCSCVGLFSSIKSVCDTVLK